MLNIGLDVLKLVVSKLKFSLGLQTQIIHSCFVLIIFSSDVGHFKISVLSDLLKNFLILKLYLSDLPSHLVNLRIFYFDLFSMSLLFRLDFGQMILFQFVNCV